MAGNTRTRVRTALLMVALALLAGCDSPQEKAADYLQKAQQFYADGDLVRARLQLRNTLQIDPKNARALYLMALVNEREEDYPAVLGNLQMAVAADPAYIDARVKLGNYYAVGRMVAETRAQADAAMALAPNGPSVRLLNAWAHYVAGERDKALEEARNALRLDPTRRDAITLVATLHAEAGRLDDALAVLDEGIGVISKADAENLRRVRVALLVQTGKLDRAEKDLNGLAADFPAASAYDIALARLFVAQNRTGEAEARIQSLIGRDPDNAQWRVQLAGLLASQSKTGDAEASLRKAVAENPESTTLRFALADFYEANQRPADALKVYEELAGSAPLAADALAARNRVVALTAATDEKKARALLGQILADAPANAEALVYRAAFSFQDNRLTEAIADLRSALVRQPDSQRALLLLARTHVRGGDPALAEDAYRRLLVLDPASTAARTELAAILRGRGDLKEVETILRDALKIAPGDQVSSSSLVATLMTQGDLAGAEAEARRMLGLGVQSGRADYDLGVALQLQNNDAQAIAAFKVALEKSPTADEPLTDLVRLLTRTGKAGEAEAYLLRHVKAQPEHVTGQILLAMLYRDTGRAAMARQLLEDLIAARPEAAGAYLALAGIHAPESAEQMAVLGKGHARSPGDPQLGLALGSAHEKRGDYEAAIRVYDATIAAGGSNDFVVNNLAVLLLDVRQDKASYARALKLTEGFAAGAKHPFNLGVLGWAHYRNGDYGNATRFLERAVTAAPQPVPQLQYYLGMAHLKAGNGAAARQALQQAVEQAAATKARFTGLAEAQTALKTLQAQAR